MHDITRYTGDVRAVLEAHFGLGQYLHVKEPQEWAQLDLTIGQLKTLMLLAVRSDQTISQLAERLGVGKPAMSILVDRLVHVGLVQRAEDALDRRRTLVALTEPGDDLVTRLRQGSLTRLADCLQAMTPADLAALRHGLEALITIAAASNGDADCGISSESSISTGANSGTVHRSE
jgi:DNA-binding MarR family transcriptional regulator